MALVVKLLVRRRGFSDKPGEQYGDPIRKRKMRVSPSARLVALDIALDEEDLREQHADLARHLLRNGRHSIDYVQGRLPGGLLDKDDTVSHSESYMTPEKMAK